MKPNLTELSPQAKNLYEQLKKHGRPIHESNMIKLIFPEPKYTSGDENAQREYWVWDVSLYGGERTRPVGSNSETFRCEPSDSYFNKVYSLYKELKNAGLVDSYNGGYNEFYFYAK